MNANNPPDIRIVDLDDDAALELIDELSDAMNRAATKLLDERFGKFAPCHLIADAGWNLFAAHMCQSIHFGILTKENAQDALDENSESCREAIEKVKRWDECVEGESMYGAPTCM